MNIGRLLLKWDDFTENIRASYHSSRDLQEFADVTLACDDGVKIEAHKIILAASSSVFFNILQSYEHPHPLIFLRGLKYDTMSQVLDFIYHGEVKLEVDQLNGFLAVAEDIKLKGISSKNEAGEKFIFSGQSALSENQNHENTSDEYLRVLSKQSNDKL